MIEYPAGGEAQVAETIYETRGHWRYHAFVTNIEMPTVEVDQFHRAHATIELAIRDLKDGAGLAHCPSGNFWANAAWLACAVLAHNLVRWTTRLGGLHPDDELTVARTIRTKFLTLPGRVVNRSGRHTLRLPARWPWRGAFLIALERLHRAPTARLSPPRDPSDPATAAQPCPTAAPTPRTAPATRLEREQHTSRAESTHTQARPATHAEAHLKSVDRG